MRWVLGIFAVVGLLVVGFSAAVATGLVSVSGFDPFAKLNAAATRPATGPVQSDGGPAATAAAEEDKPTDSEASLAALKHPGYEDRVVFLSAADAEVAGPKVRVEARSASGAAGYTSRRGGNTVDPKNRLPNALVRSWAGPDDSAEWTFACPKAGRYVVTFDCVPGTGGSKGRGTAGGKFVIAAGGQQVVVEVEGDVSGRRGSSSFHLIDVGQIALPAGRVTLRISPQEKDAGLLSLRSVRLYPAE